MTKHKMILKGLLGATALTLFTVGNAHAQLTPAGTSVRNTFTLDYKVSGVDQPQIDTDDGSPTSGTFFTVDRLIDLTVTSNGDVNVAPGAVDRQLIFELSNDGNDTQAYALSIVEESGDDFDTVDPVSTAPVIRYYIDDGDGLYEPGVDDGSLVTYDPLNPPVLAPDAIIWVVVTQDIGAEADGTQADISLIADTLDSTAPFAATAADGDATNSILGVAENVLNDGSSTANEVANAGDDSATASYLVVAADIAASKAVTIHSQDGSTCTSVPGTPIAGGYGIPGACMEYVITVVNTGSTAATDIIINDVLADELDFGTAVIGGDFTLGSFSPALPAATTDCTSSACVVNMIGATLPAPISPATSTTGTVTIRAYVK